MTDKWERDWKMKFGGEEQDEAEAEDGDDEDSEDEEGEEGLEKKGDLIHQRSRLPLLLIDQ